jgi:radical SAM superfamily enzyme YgiQ (UPF0313 family)
MTPSLLLISLRDPYLDSDRVMPPLGVMSLYSYLRGCGIAAAIENDFDPSDMEKYSEYSHFGISCMTPQKDQAMQILHRLKAAWPERKVILGGPHVHFYLNDCLNEPFDHLITGDGEFALREVMRGVATARVLDMPVSEAEMNELPLPFRDPAFLNQYSFEMQGLRATTILTAKGCPMGCAFCEHAGTKLKLYRPEHVGRQIDQAKAAGFEAIMFFDDIFCLSLKRVRELGQEVALRKMPYRCFGHARTMSPEMAEALASTGCIEIGFGAESGSQAILDTIGKRTTVQQNINFIEICNRHRIKVKAFIMLGLPGETHGTVAETSRFLEHLMSRRFTAHDGLECANDFDLTVYFPYKGTKIREAIDRDPRAYDLTLVTVPERMKGFYKGQHGTSEVAVRTAGLSAQELNGLREELYHTYKKPCG